MRSVGQSPSAFTGNKFCFVSGWFSLATFSSDNPSVSSALSFVCHVLSLGSVTVVSAPASELSVTLASDYSHRRLESSQVSDKSHGIPSQLNSLSLLSQIDQLDSLFHRQDIARHFPITPSQTIPALMHFRSLSKSRKIPTLFNFGGF